MTAESEEKSIFDAADFDQLAELKALVRSLRRAGSFSLLFARCNQRPKQSELQKKVIAELPEKNIAVIFFENGIENLLDELRQRLNDEKPDAVFIYGLESSMPRADKAFRTPFVLNLNASRNAFPSVADCPFVFWLPDYGIRAIMNGAPDFFSVRSGVFFFHIDEETLSQQISQAVSIGHREHDTLLLEERKQRLENLEALLTEYQSLPDNKRDFDMEYELKDRLANIYYKSANFSEAGKIFNELLHSDISKENKKYSSQLNNLASVYDSQGRYGEAIELFKQALLIGEKTIGKEHPDYAAHLNNLANVYRSQGRYDEAIELYKQALLIGEKTIGKEHPAYAVCLNNLALVYKSQGKYDEAIELFKQALMIDEKTIGKEHLDYAAHLNNLASAFRSQGRYDEAIELFKQALQIGEKTIGKEHPTYATDLNNLALVYYSQSRYDEALPMYEEALRIYVKFLGENHPWTQKARKNLEICRAEMESSNSLQKKKSSSRSKRKTARSKDKKRKTK